MVSTSGRVVHGTVVWSGKPWITPLAIARSVIVLVVAILILLLEMNTGVAISMLGGFPIYIWTLAVFALIWVISIFELLIFWLSNTYMLRQDGLEIRQGIIRLHSFVVTPAGFGDLSVDQSLLGRIFGYGDITVNSQGERKTKLRLVHSPFAVADTMRDIMGKPIVRVESHV